MTQQLSFNWTWAQRKQWIDESILCSGVAHDGSPVSAQTMANLLNVINDHLGENCEAWPSQVTIAQKMKVSTKTIQRASQALAHKSLLIVEERGCRTGTQNYYRIVWTELQLLQPARREAWHRMLAGQSLEPSDILTEPSDSLTEPSDSLTEPSDNMSDKQTITNKKIPKQTTNRERLVVVVVDLGIGKAEDAIDGAYRLGLSNDDIEHRIATWKSQLSDEQRPGVLFNWLTKRGSWEASQRACRPTQLRLASDLTEDQVRKRADLIRYLRKEKKLNEFDLQLAVERFEQNCRSLATSSATP